MSRSRTSRRPTLDRARFAEVGSPTLDESEHGGLEGSLCRLVGRAWSTGAIAGTDQVSLVLESREEGGDLIVVADRPGIGAVVSAPMAGRRLLPTDDCSFEATCGAIEAVLDEAGALVALLDATEAGLRLEAGPIGGARAMRDHHKDQLIEVLMHYLPMEIRGHLMRQCPEAYNGYCGSEVVRVVRTCDGEPVLS